MIVSRSSFSWRTRLGWKRKRQPGRRLHSITDYRATWPRNVANYAKRRSERRSENSNLRKRPLRMIAAPTLLVLVGVPHARVHHLSRDCVGLTGWLEPTWNNTVLSVASGESFAYHGSRLGCVSHLFPTDFSASFAKVMFRAWYQCESWSVYCNGKRTRGKILSRMFFFLFFLFSRGGAGGTRLLEIINDVVFRIRIWTRLERWNLSI